MKKIITICKKTTEREELILDGIGFYTHWNSDKEYLFEPYKDIYSLSELHTTLKQIKNYLDIDSDFIVIETIS